VPFGRPISLGSLRLALEDRLVAVAGDPVDRREVRLVMIVAGDDVVNLVAARQSAHVTDAPIALEDVAAQRGPSRR
jgi:hypothetical protein